MSNEDDFSILCPRASWMANFQKFRTCLSPHMFFHYPRKNHPLAMEEEENGALIGKMTLFSLLNMIFPIETGKFQVIALLLELLMRCLGPLKKCTSSFFFIHNIHPSDKALARPVFIF